MNAGFTLNVCTTGGLRGQQEINYKFDTLLAAW